MAQSRPNVLLIFTDQQRFDTIGALGNPIIKTPNLDRLVRSGVAFTDNYTASPVCVSARCSMIYGQYPVHTGCYENMPMPIDNRPSFMQALTDAGYRTHGIGKCHHHPDRASLRGFQTRQTQEEMTGGPNQDDYMNFLAENGIDHLCDPHGCRGEMYYIPQIAQMPAKFHPTQWIGDQSVRFIEEQKKGGQPWYLYSSFVHPHPPFAPPSPWHKLYRAPMMPLPRVPQDVESLHTYVNKFQNRYKYRDQGIDQNLMRNMKAHYYACISFIDFQIGRMLDTLEKSGQLDHTLILFTADHGEHLGDYNCFGKRSMHDTCARTPMLARLPGRFEGGRLCSQVTSIVDIAPTVLSATGAHLDSKQLDGVDLAEVAAGTCPRETVFIQYSRRERAIYTAVSRRWKYAYSAPDNAEFLFDRVGDPLETRNRAHVYFAHQPREAMKRTLMDYLAAGGETDALEDGKTWKAYPKLELSTDPDAHLLVQDHPWAKTAIPGYTDIEG